jgi:hypothetical protein
VDIVEAQATGLKYPTLLKYGRQLPETIRAPTLSIQHKASKSYDKVRHDIMSFSTHTKPSSPNSSFPTKMKRRDCKSSGQYAKPKLCSERSYLSIGRPPS